MSITEIPVRTVGDLSREILALQDLNEHWLFRGHSNADWALRPGIHRGYTAQQERYLTNEFRVRARSRYAPCPSNNDYSGWLALMQHYGLPTRLLDWSYSPLIATFFAVHPDYSRTLCTAGRAACIWAMAAGRLNDAQGFEPFIFPLDAASYEPLVVPAFKNREEPGTVGVAMALEHDARIQLQQSAFTIHSASIPIETLKGSERWLRKFTIEGDAITELFGEISRLGMRQSNLFPDLPSLAAELKCSVRTASREQPSDE
jgi:hypothetical protein